MKEVHDLVFETLSNLATESQLTHIKQKLAEHNAEIERDCQLIQAEIAKQQAQLDTVKQKKEQYLDSLITGNFSQKERKLINDKIDEFSLLEKQLKDWLKTNVERIILDQDVIKMDVKKLPFRLE